MSCDSTSEALGDGLVLWVASVAASGAAHEPPDPPPEWLSPPERAEWERFATRKRADEFAACRKLLRAALGRDDIIVERDAHRAPTVAGAPPFSLCHAGGRALVLTGPPGTRVGVDAEPVDRTIADATLALMARADELEALRADPPRARLRAWVAKECVQKVLGRGMRCDPRTIDARADPEMVEGVAVAVRFLEREGLLVAVGRQKDLPHSPQRPGGAR